MRARVLVAEDNADLRDLLQEILEDEGYKVIVAADGREALTQIEQRNCMIDLVITDVQMPGLSGDKLLSIVREKRGETPIIVITAFGSVEQAVEMVKGGAFQYLTKPFENGKLLSLVKEALDQSAPQREQARIRRESSSIPPKIIGASRSMKTMFEQIAVAARSGCTALITGESGTGKELVARAVHEMSGRKGQFIPINCAAIPADLIEAELFGHVGGAFTGAKQSRAGLFEAADKGTIFLDEIGELPMLLQPKLLRVLQENSVRRIGANNEHKIDLHVVAATNSNLENKVNLGEFRDDLFWRLNVIRISIPALRSRVVDIPLLIDHFIEKYCSIANRPPLELSPEASAIMTTYSWPGNIRQLENAVEHAIIFAKGAVITPANLPEQIRASGSVAVLIAKASERNLSMYDVEREYILEIMRRTDGNKKRAAEILGMDRKTLYRKLDDYRSENISLEV